MLDFINMFHYSSRILETRDDRFKFRSVKAVLYPSKQLAMIDNASCVSDGLQDDVAAMSASSLEHLTYESRDKPLDPVQNLDRSSKTRQAERQRAVFCQVEGDCDAFGMVGFSLVVCRQDLVFGVLAVPFVRAVPLSVSQVSRRVHPDFTLDVVDLSDVIDDPFFQFGVPGTWCGFDSWRVVLDNQNMACNKPTANDIFSRVVDKPVGGAAHDSRDRDIV